MKYTTFPNKFMNCPKSKRVSFVAHSFHAPEIRKGGDGGNRTRVRKLLPPNFYKLSLAL